MARSTTTKPKTWSFSSSSFAELPERRVSGQGPARSVPIARMSTRTLRRALLVLAGLVVLTLPRSARAESGTLNLHIDLGAGAPIAGPARPGGQGNATAAGGTAFVGLDWQVRTPWAIEALLGFGGFAKPIPGSGLTGTPFVSFGLGARLRLLDDGHGYL